jgi:hypothetical protein
MFALKDGYWANKPKADAIYGPTGEVDQTNHQENVEGVNQTLKSEFLTDPKFCARCHHGCPESVPFKNCRSLYSSYVENYVEKGGKETCQGCHMPMDPEIEMASHRFPGVHDKEFFAKALDIFIEAESTHFINNYKNELTPTLHMNVKVTSTSGHGIPNG